MLLNFLLEPRQAELDELRSTALMRKTPGAHSMVASMERAIAASRSKTISFAPDGTATVEAAGHRFAGGRFQLRSIGELRAAARALRGAQATTTPAHRARLSVVAGGDLFTDIGALQANADRETLFQVASQFNCLEATSPRIVPVTEYFSDNTQGPRASISAFPGTLVRHYAAPTKEGSHFVQKDSVQLNLLADALPESLGRVQSGYLSSDGIRDAAGAADALVERFDAIQVGVHDGVQVVLGQNWDGAVEGDRQIAQVFTSTFAGGGYSPGVAITGPLETLCRQLLRAAYLGTLLSAVSLGERRVVLTMIGGGAFGNPHRLIWESILWACDETDGLLSGPLDVVLNGREVGQTIDRKAIRAATEARQGVFVEVHNGRVTSG